MPHTADLLARRLYQAGCRHAFGIPGGEVLTLLDALEAAGIRFALTKHENGAGFMAEGVHQMDGAPGILADGPTGHRWGEPSRSRGQR